MSDYLFRGDLAKLDPDVYELTQLEQERQYRKLILIVSESKAHIGIYMLSYFIILPCDISNRFTEPVQF